MNEDGMDDTYPGMDHISTAELKAANISTAMLPSLSKEVLRDLFPGPEHFFRRRTIWRFTHGENEGQESDLCRPPLGPVISAPLPTPFLHPPVPSIPHPSPNPRDQHGATRTIQLVSPQYVLYTDTELEKSRSTFFEKQHAGQEGDYILPKDLRC